MKKTLKICSPQLGLNPKSNLGGEVHDYFLLKGLASEGNKIFVYLPKGRPYEKHNNIYVENASIKHIPALVFNFLILPYLFKTYRSEHFDILRVHNPYFVGLGALLFKLFHPEVKIVVTYHLKEESLLFDLINRYTVSKYDKVVCVSNYLKEWLQKKYLVEPKKIEVIYNGIDPKLKPKKKSKKLISKYNLENKFTLLYMGLLIPRKNPLFLLKIYRSFKKKEKYSALLISGTGPLKSKMVDFIKRNNLKDVHFLGNIFNNEKVEVFNSSDVLLMPSLNEGFGLVVAEAMACAKPVIVANNTSLKEITRNNESGFTASLDDVNDWVNKLNKLKKKKTYKQISANSLKRSRQFQWKVISSKYQNLYEGLND